MLPIVRAGANVQNNSSIKTKDFTYFKYLRFSKLFFLQSMKKFSFIILMCFTIGYSNPKTHKELIKGNWHSSVKFTPRHVYDPENEEEMKTHQYNYQYSEFFFSDQYYYAYHDVMGFTSPFRYTIKKDSLYMFMNSKQDSIPIVKYKINFLDANKLIVTHHNDSISYYRMESNKHTIDRFVIPDSIDRDNRFKKNVDTFDSLFLKRFNEEFRRHVENQK
jgi:hypothetical protein